MLVRLINLTIVTVESKKLHCWFLLCIAKIMQVIFCEKHIKKALLLSAFFVLNFLLYSPIFANSCSPDRLSLPEKAIVKWVYDGDTLLLKDKRKIRVIGIDTPEVKHHKQKAQAYGAKAREALRELLKSFNYHVILRYGPEKQDRYSRILAHVYLPDGTNISRWLLKKGYAKTLAFPPNIKLAKCYKTEENKAQRQSLRIWRYKSNQIKTVESLSRTHKGYVRLEGIIKKIKHNKKSLIMSFKGSGKRVVRLKIKKKHLKYFKKMTLDKLQNKTILVTGMIRERYGKRTIHVSYPTQLKIMKKNHARTIKSKSNSVIKWSLDNAH